jgi:predicted CXXCH cytochrome family protein
VNLRFDHGVHVRDQGMDCADCHAAPGTANRMAVVQPGPDVCLQCHGEPGAHLAAATECATCHAPLAAAPQVPGARLASYPRPDDHAAADFVLAHADSVADVARCAVCHAQESCERCHLDAARRPAIQALGRDPRLAALVQGRPGSWPEPPSHGDPRWSFEHGRAAAAAMQDCAACHTRSSCETCHAEAKLGSLAVLMEPPAGDGRGVRLVGAHPPGHAPGFERHHAAAAASGAMDCAACHSPSYCNDCHRAAARPGFHAPDFVHQHAAAAYARDTDCASCHSTEAFCRDCHAGAGLSPGDPRTAAYHDAQPFWLLTHGQAARQGMESCAACHQQTDCLRCHSARSGWRIDPHGPDFDPDRLGDRSLESCAVCHFADPRHGR